VPSGAKGSQGDVYVDGRMTERSKEEDEIAAILCYKCQQQIFPLYNLIPLSQRREEERACVLYTS